MSETESIQNYEILDGDDDVLLFSNNNTLTVGKLKELFRSQFRGKFIDSYTHRGLNHVEIKSDLSNISLDLAFFVCSEIQCKYTEVNCKLLKVGSGGWQEGKLRIQTNVVNFSRLYEKGNFITQKDIILDISVEFCLDRPPEIPLSLEPESPLDEIRQSAEYKNL